MDQRGRTNTATSARAPTGRDEQRGWGARTPRGLTKRIKSHNHTSGKRASTTTNGGRSKASTIVAHLHPKARLAFYHDGLIKLLRQRRESVWRFEVAGNSRKPYHNGLTGALGSWNIQMRKCGVGGGGIGLWNR